MGHRHQPLSGNRRRRRPRARGPCGLAGLLLLVPCLASAGSVSGQVVFRGEVPVPAPIAALKDRGVCGERVPAEGLVVARGTLGVQQAVVFLEGVGAVQGPPPGEAKLENRGCRFVPHVLAVRVGTELLITNADPVLHNLHAWLMPEHRSIMNVVQPTQGQETRRTVRRPGVMAITCDSHVHMLAHLLAFEHPYFALTDGTGAFRISGIPPGTYRLTAWHEGWRVVRTEPEGRPVYEAPYLLSQDVVIPESGEARLTLELAPRP